MQNIRQETMPGVIRALVCGAALGLGTGAIAATSRVTFEKPNQRWLWGGFGFHNSEATMTPMMSDEFRDERVLKTFREISPTYSRVFAGYADWTKEAMDAFADYYDATFRGADEEQGSFHRHQRRPLGQ